MKKSQNSGQVAILDGDSPTGLAFARSLGQLGIPIHVYAPQTISVARWSRYCHYFSRCPDPNQADVFLPWLRKTMQKGKTALVAPTSDLIAFYMAAFTDHFPPLQAKAVPAAEQILDMLFKDRFDARCRQLGQSCPWTYSPSSTAEALAMAKDLTYPLLLKPKTHVGVGLARGQVVHSAEQLHQCYAPYPIAPHNQTIAKRYPQLLLPMLQALVPNALKHLYSISGIVAPGKPLIWSAAQKCAQWPPELGIGIVFKGLEPPLALREQAEGFIRAMVGQGIFELEYIYDESSGKYLAVDLNPRTHGHVSFDIARGIDLPLLWYNWVMYNEWPEAPPVARSDITWQHGIPFHVSQWAKLLKGPNRQSDAQAYWRALTKPHVDIVFSAQDKLPWLLHAARMLRHPKGLWRSFWQFKEALPPDAVPPQP